MALKSLSSPALLKQRSSAWFITIVVAMAIFTDVLFYGLIIPFLPVILRERVGVAGADVQLWTSVLLGVYGGAIFIASPICGYLADRSSSRQLPLLVGLVAMTCSTAMLHFGATIWILVTARVFQGLAAAILYSAGLALLYDSVGKDRVGQAMGFVTLAITAGTFLGPSLGGILYSVGNESAAFGLAYGIIGIDLILRLLVVEKGPTSSNGESAASPSYGTMNSSTAEDADDASEHPAQDEHPQAAVKYPTLRLLKAPRLWTALFGWFVVGTLLTAFDSVIPIFVQSTFGYSTAGAGIIFIPLFVPNLGGPLYGRIVDRSPQAGRLLAASGFILCLPFFVLLRLVDSRSTTSQVVLCVLLFAIGLGLAVCGPPLMVEVGRTVTEIEDKYPGAFGRQGATARAYGLYNCAFAAGQLVGPLWAGGVKSTLGWATMAWMLGLLSGLTGIVILLFLGGWIGVARNRKGAEVDNSHEVQEQERLLS